jgi:hypothetical protein
MTHPVAGNRAPSTSDYPIIAGRGLDEARRRGPLGIRPARREPGEMIRPDAGHHVLVYKVDNTYVMDNGGRDGRDEQVIRASHVSVVDMRREAPVMVEFRIPSKDSAEFTVRVTFGCTVTDPITIVRDGITDPRAILTSYLKSYHNVMQMGLEFELDDINAVRRSIDDELTAYRAVVPPHIDGFDVKMASIEVLTPDEVRQVSQSRRGMRDQHTIATDRLDYWGRYESARVGVQHDLDMAMQKDRQERDFHQREFDEFMQRRDQDHQDDLAYRGQMQQLRRQAELSDFRRSELREAAELLRSDPDMALYLAYVEGQANPLAVSDQLRADRDRRALRAEAEADKDRGERATREQREYDRATRAMELAQAERMEELAAKRDDAQVERERARRLAVVAEQRQILELNWQREDKVEKAKADREEARRRIDAQFKLLSDLIARGHFDTADVDLVRVVSQFTAGGINPLDAPGEAIGVTANENGAETGREAGDDKPVDVNDGR